MNGMGAMKKPPIAYAGAGKWWKARHFVFRGGMWYGYSSKWKAEHGGAVYAWGSNLRAVAATIRLQRQMEGPR